MPETALADAVHASKYRAPGESFREAMNRIANALKDDDAHFRGFRDALLNQRILPAGRVQAAAGSPRLVTAYNCFVAPTIEDSFTDGPNSIMGVATQAARTMRMGGGIGYDFSTLRPRGDAIRSLGENARSSGPVSFMSVFDSVCLATMSAGDRRGAQMGVLRVDHPDVEEFIRAKQNTNRLTGFNISLAVTDEFMMSVHEDGTFQLTWRGEPRGRLNARALWEEIMRSTWDWAEPGVLFIDRINEMNNLWWCEKIAATNPCGEQPLPPYGACLLWSLNLTRYLRGKDFDWSLLAIDVRAGVRAMDNVIDRTIYPLPEQKMEAISKRRMGMGVTGLANAIEALGHPYGSEGFLAKEAEVLNYVRNRAYFESTELARERGVFPLYHRERYLEGKFVATLPGEIRDAIARNGIRNSHLTSIAPTGTISLAADNVSSGIEPVYAHEARRTIIGERGPEVHDVVDYGLRVFGVRGKTAAECSTDDHLNVLSTAQRYVDSAVSKTINVDPSTRWEDFKEIYLKAWSLGCKGVTTFNAGGKRGGIFEVKTEDGGACRIDPETGSKTCE